MSESVHFPSDLLQLPPFRQLSQLLGGDCFALGAWWVLFSQLHYLAQEGVAPGRVPEPEQEMFKKTLGEMGAEMGIVERELRVQNADGTSALPGSEVARPTWLFDLYVEAKLLRRDGTDWVCPRYQALHSGDRFSKGVASLGGNMKAFKQKQKRVNAEAMQQSLNILDAKFVDETGAALSPDEIQRVTRLIISCDNALYKPSRPPMGFTEGLIQAALAKARAMSDEQIDYVCEHIALHRAHPRLAGLTTERLLPQFGDMMRTLS